MSKAPALASLDFEGGGRFALPGAEGLVAAVDLPYDVVAQAANDDRAFVVVVAGGRRMPMREIAPLRRYWVVQQGLVAGDDLARLLWILGHFRNEVEVDLLQRVGVRLGDLWQRREWRLLLNLIDHLPRTTWTQQAMANHPEYAEKVAEAIAKRRSADVSDEAPSYPLLDWSPEVAGLAAVVDAVNALRSTLIAVNLERGKQPPKIEPFPRPRPLVDTMVDKKERALRWARHEDLTRRLLPAREK